MTNGPITITELPLTEAAKPGPTIDLGASKSIQNNVNTLLGAMQRQARKAFCLKWEGGKIPRGATVGGHVIAWTQHGKVTANGGQNIGTYKRIVEFGGDNGNSHEMHVFLR